MQGLTLGGRRGKVCHHREGVGWGGLRVDGELAPALEIEFRPQPMGDDPDAG